MHITRKKLFHTIFDKKLSKIKTNWKFFIKYLGQYNVNVYYQLFNLIMQNETFI